MARRSIAREVEAVKRNLDNHPIVIVGLMGAGKTSIGRRLAARLGLPFRDADTEIETAAGCTIPDIFERFGFDKREPFIAGANKEAEKVPVRK